MNIKCKHVMYVVCKLQLLPQLKGNPNYFLFTCEQQLKTWPSKLLLLHPYFSSNHHPLCFETKRI